MGANMKVKLAGLLIIGSLFIPGTAFAGWGAIACNPNNTSCGVSYGWPTLASAKAYALIECRKANLSCHIYRWELNECIRGPRGSYTCN